MEKFSKSFLSILGGILFTAINLVNLSYYNQEYFPFSLGFIKKIGLSFLFVLSSFIGLKIIQWLIKQINTENSIFMILGLAFILRLAWVIFVRTPPTQDYLQLLKASQAFANGNYDYTQTNRYLELYPYMNGFVIYQGLLLKLFFSNLFVLKLINCLFSVGTVYFLMKIALHLFGEKTSIIAGLLLALYIPNIVLTSVLTNDIVATFLFYLAFYLIICAPLNMKKALFIGFFLFLGNIIRPMASVILLALALYGLFILLSQQEKKVSFFISFGTIFLTFFTMSFGTDQLLLKTGLATQSGQSTNLYWKIALGLNQETNGKWNQEDYDYVTAGKTPTLRDKYAKQLVSKRLNAPKKLARLMKKKFMIMWGDFDTSISWATKKTDIPRWSIVLLTVIQKCEYMIISFGALKIFWQKDLPDGFYFLLIVIIGYVLVHQLIEIQTRYRYLIMPLFMLFAGKGLEVSSLNLKKGND
ncbi:MAG TPA: glycosyltransferase family 39 protein [Candidatus Tetragenococcus pullicola]|nr:glycosyltransferase family 39 protein [Candidatus Tetragenococcus pullicola]